MGTAIRGLIRLLQFLLDKILALALFLGGIGVAVYLYGVDYFANVPEQGRPYTGPVQTYLDAIPSEQLMYWQIGGIVAAFVGFLLLIPRVSVKVKKILKYKTEDGQVELNLVTVQSALNKVINELDEVKSIKIQVSPQKNGRSFALQGDVVLVKNDERGARDLAAYVRQAMINTTQSVLGSEADVPVDLYVSGVVLGKDANMLDVASQPALATQQYTSNQIEDKWTQSGRDEERYLPEEESDGEHDRILAEDEPQNTPEPEAQPTPTQTTAEQEAPERKESPYATPENERDPEDSIGNIIMVDEENDDAVPEMGPGYEESQDNYEWGEEKKREY